MLAKFRNIAKFRYVSEISLHSANFTCSKMFCSLFLCINDPVLVNFIAALDVTILFRMDWYFHLVVRLHNPFCEHFVT